MKRKFIGVLLALVLVLSFSLVTAVPVAAQATLNVHPLVLGVKTGDSTAQWSTTQAKNGSYSAYLDTGTTTQGDGDEARIEITMPSGTTLSDLTSISWWVYAASGYPPHLDITLDCDGDTVVDNEDMLTAEMNLNCVGAPKSIATLTSEISYNTGWLQTFELTSADGFGAITDSTTFWVTKMGSGDLNAPSGTLAQWKAGTVASDPESEMTTPVITGSTPVVKLEIEVDNWVVNSDSYVDDVAINGVVWYGLIQDAIDVAAPTDTISVAAGTYNEDLSIPAGKDNLELKPATGAAVTIKGVGIGPGPEFPYTVPNIDILADGVTIHGFTIESPDAVVDKYASGMLIGASDVEIYDNAFKVHTQATGQYSVVIQTWRKVVIGFETVDISGLDIHDNTFDDLGDGTVGYDGIYVNIDAGTGPIAISDNDFTGSLIRAIAVERSNVVISGNTIITDLGSGFPGGHQGIFIGCYELTTGGDDGPVQSNVSITGNTVKGATASEGFTQGIRIGHSSDQIGFSDITVSGNTVEGNVTGVIVRARAGATPVDVVINYNNIVGNTTKGVDNATVDAVLIDATCNWWGDIAGPDTSGGSPPHNPYTGWTAGDAVSDDVDYLPWLIRVDLATGWNIVSFPIMGEEPAEPPPPPEEILAAYWFDSSTQYWNFDPYQAGALDAMYIKVTAPTSLAYPVSSEPTFPGVKEMKVGWNFIGLAQLYPMDLETEALYDAFYGTGETELVGYNRVISPSLNGDSWDYVLRGGSEVMYPIKGYWVLMVNDGTLGGFTTTPIVEVAVPIPGP